MTSGSPSIRHPPYARASSTSPSRPKAPARETSTSSTSTLPTAKEPWAPSSKLHRYLLKQPSITLNPFLTPRSFMPRGELFSNRMKKFFEKVHLWLSLPAGIVIVITCLTGAMMVFQDEIEQLCHPRRYIVANYEGRTPLPYTAMSG